MMKNRFQSFSFLLTLGAVLGPITWGGLLQAQQTPPQTQQPMPETQQPPQQQPPTQAPDQSGQQTPSQEQTPSAQQPSTQQPSSQTPSTQPPDSQAQSSDANGVQTFTGTVVKQGDKYVLQDAATGTTYDIDHQDEVKKFDGKKVRVHGTLDASTKMIHVQ
jgi:uncharacterized protein YdeI (BOF family)